MLHKDYLKAVSRERSRTNESLASARLKWNESSPYLLSQIGECISHVVKANSNLLHVHCGVGSFLRLLKPSEGIGIEDSHITAAIAQSVVPNMTILTQEFDELILDEGMSLDYVLITDPEDLVNIQAILNKIKRYCQPHTRVVFGYYNFLWSPAVKFARRVMYGKSSQLSNWIGEGDVTAFLDLSGFETLSTDRVILCPIRIPLLGRILNSYLARFPGINLLTVYRITSARPFQISGRHYGVSIIVPCKDEAGNVLPAVMRMPKLGLQTEIIFCDDQSIDGTPEAVSQLIQDHPDREIRLINGPGIDKAENVWTGLDAARYEILMILDGDLAVAPEELSYFYDAIQQGKGEFINGSRLVYPMENNAMRFANTIGNKLFSLFFSYIIGTRIKDTLCGTKVFWKRDYQRMRQYRNTWGVKDKWGDYELLLSAASLGLKIIDLPVHYRDRLYGKSKMTNRLSNGWRMLRLCFSGLRKIKFR